MHRVTHRIIQLQKVGLRSKSSLHSECNIIILYYTASNINVPVQAAMRDNKASPTMSDFLLVILSDKLAPICTIQVAKQPSWLCFSLNMNYLGVLMCRPQDDV